MKLRVMVGLTMVALTTACAVKPASEPAGKTATSQVGAATKSQATAKTVNAVHKDGSKIRCVEEPVTNSRLRKNKVCMTEDAWNDRTERARSAWDEARSPMTGRGPDPRQEGNGPGN